MRVKIGNVWYDSSEQPICIQISKEEQQQIAGLDRSSAVQGKYAVFPEWYKATADEMVEWMNGENDEDNKGDEERRFVVDCWIRVEQEADEELLTYEEALKEVEQGETLFPENIYKIRDITEDE